MSKSNRGFVWPDGQPMHNSSRPPMWLWVVPGVKESHRRMWAVLKSFTGKNCRTCCWPSVAAIAARYGLNGKTARRTALRILAEMAQLGLVQIEHQYRAGGLQIVSKYWLAVDSPFPAVVPDDEFEAVDDEPADMAGGSF